MPRANPLDIDYRHHERVRRLVDTVRFCVEDISLSFDRWDEPYTTGPGLYFAVVSGRTVRDHADPMGNNRWPVEDSRDVLEDVDSFYEATNDVARTRDGAVVISVDGIVQIRWSGSGTPPRNRPTRRPLDTPTGWGPDT